jgi:hypothetical protein
MNAPKGSAAPADANIDGDLWLDEKGLAIVSPQGMVSPLLATFEELLSPKSRSSLAAAWARERQARRTER